VGIKAEKAIMSLNNSEIMSKDIVENLKELELEEIHLSPENVSEFVRFILNFKSLEKLHFRDI
jgi:hypothetical protein